MKWSWGDSGNLKQITFDAGVSETHLLSATITQHPVETGVAITDHVRPEPFRLSMEVCISNVPVDMPSASDDSFTDGIVRQSTQVDLALLSTQRITTLASGNQAAKTSTVNQSAKATVWQFSSRFDRVRKVYEAILDLWQAPPSTGITVQTSLALYDMMEIVQVSAPRSSDMGTSAIQFSIDMQQIRTVQSQEVAPPAPKAAKKSRGHKPTKEETNADQATFLQNAVGDKVEAYFKAVK